MTPDPRAALARLVAALEGHLDAAANRRGEADPAVEAAYQRLADAFEVYDTALYSTYDEVTPLVLYDDVEDEREDEELDGIDEDDVDDVEEVDDLVDDTEDDTEDEDDTGDEEDVEDDEDLLDVRGPAERSAP
ncbi:primosomal protein [Kineococcus glutinatus]|uniref:Primosomal protein n=1 Tax=Kineococcus glutinatus TaxID=1070872 RepID=A0ABP9IB83_9ACTN